MPALFLPGEARPDPRRPRPRAGLPEPSPLSPLPSPARRPGEGDLAEAVVPIGSRLKKEAIRLIRRIRPITPTRTSLPQQGPPLPAGGRAMGEGTGVRFRPGHGRYFAFALHSPPVCHIRKLI